MHHAAQINLNFIRGQIIIDGLKLPEVLMGHANELGEEDIQSGQPQVYHPLLAQGVLEGDNHGA